MKGHWILCGVKWWRGGNLWLWGDDKRRVLFNGVGEFPVR